MARIPNLKLFFAKISRKKRLTAVAMPDIYIASRSFFLRDIASDAPADTQAYGVLREVDGFGQNMGEVIADDKYGSFKIDVTRGSTDHDKRFYDIFEEDTILHQPVILYSLEVPIDSLTGSGSLVAITSLTMADWRIEFSGEITNIKIDPKGNGLNIAIKTKLFPDDSPVYQATKVNFPLISNEGSGRFLPLIFGSCTVPLYFLSSQRTNPTTYNGIIYNQSGLADFGYASNFYNANANNSFIVGSILNRYARGYDGEFHDILFPVSTQNDLADLFPLKSAVNVEMRSSFEGAFFADGVDLFKYSSSQNYLVTGAWGVFEIWDNNPATLLPAPPNALLPKVKFTFLEGAAGTAGPINELITASADWAFTRTVAGSGPMIPFAAMLVTPLLLHSNLGYFIAPTVEDPNLPRGYYTGGFGVQYRDKFWTNSVHYNTLLSFWQRPRESNDQNFIPWVGGVGGPSTQGHPVVTPSVAGRVTADTSLQYAYERLRQIIWSTATARSNPSWSLISAFAPRVKQYANDLPSVDLQSCDLSKLDMVFEVEGLKTQSTFLTGTSGQLITRPDHIIKFLYYLSRGYSLTGLDTTTFSPGTYALNLDGFTEGKESYRQIMLDILENSASKLVPRAGGSQLALWSYGVSQSVVETLTESDCTLDDIEILAEDAIVNRVRCNYAKSSIPLNSTSQQQGNENFQASLEVNHAVSQQLYGVRELSGDFVQLKYVKSKAAAERWANYKLSQYSRERIYITFTVPFWKKNYRLIELMDKIDFSHIDNPSYFGSASSAKERPLTTDGVAVASDYNLGDIWRRAKQFQMRVLGRRPRYSINAEEATIQFKCIVLNNPDEIS